MTVTLDIVGPSWSCWCSGLSLEVAFLGELGEKELDQVALRERIERWTGSRLLSRGRGRLSDWLGLRNGNLCLLDGRVVVGWSSGCCNHLRGWKNWSGNLELTRIHIGLVSGAEERLRDLRCAWQQVGRHSVRSRSLFDNRRRLVGAGSLNGSAASLGGLE